MTANLPDRLFDQLRNNLRAAGVPATEADFAGIVEKGFLNRVPAFLALLDGMPAASLPDYLAQPAPPSGAQPQPAGGPAMAPPPDPAGATDPLDTISAIAPLLRSRRLSAIELTEQCLARIDAQDVQLNAFQLVIAATARKAAAYADAEIAAGNYRGPLHGVPVAVKDLFDMVATPTTAGSRILAETMPATDATIVARLTAAGAIIVGKTRLSEFAYSPGSNNAHYGPTRNPHHPDHDSGGSSSGSAAAVAAGLAYAALGSDTGGSVRIPAALCGIVGLKPTFGRISLAGAVPLSFSLDHPGPLTRTVADAALLLTVLAGPDPRDGRTLGAPPLQPVDLDAGVRGLRIGVLGDDGSGAPLATAEALGAWQAGLSRLQDAGAELVPLDLPELAALRVVASTILAIEAATYHLPWLRTRLDDYGEFMRQRVLAAFAYDGRAFVQAQQLRQSLRNRCAAIFQQVDLLSTPAQPDQAPPLGVPASLHFTNPFNVLGWPAVSVPCGLSSAGLPFGLQLVGAPWDEATVLRVAQVVEG